MSRFFKSAAFPILLVILLAFLVQTWVFNSSGSKAMTSSAFQAAVLPGFVLMRQRTRLSVP